MTPTVALPPQVRAVLYYVVFVLGVLVIVGTAIFGSLGGVWPVWFKAFAAGSAAFGSALGLTAASNTQTGNKTQADDVPDELADQPVLDGHHDLDEG